MIYQPIVFDRPTGENLGPGFASRDAAETWKDARIAAAAYRYPDAWGYVTEYESEAAMRAAMFGVAV